MTMSDKSEYTIEIWRRDARYKAGKRLIGKCDHKDITEDQAKRLVILYNNLARGNDCVYYKTYVTKKNLISGIEFQERYDTPHYCSPSSETYWSM